MKFEPPIPEEKVPTRRSMPPAHYMELYEAVMKLPEGKVLPVVMANAKEAGKFAASLQHSKFASFKVMQRDDKLFVRLRNEKDDEQARHIRELREKARARKANAG